MNRPTDALCFIREQVSYPEDNKNFGYEVCKTSDPSRFYVKFKSTLQSFGVQNRNKRYYDAQNIMDNIEKSEYIQSMLRQNSWVGELDHPSETINGQTLTLQRISNPDPKHDSHFIRKPWLEGNLLKAPIQTDSGTEEGMNLAIKIVDGGLIPAFSARVFGELQNRSGRPTVMAKRLITYDEVLFPSHREALADVSIPQIMESASVLEEYSGCTVITFPELARMAAGSSRETEWLCESFGLSINDVIGVTNTGNSVVVSENNRNVYFQPITDKHIRQRVQRTLKDFLNQ